MDSMNDQLSIKNLLFSKAIPNYVIPVPTAGHKVYSCTDCGDKFIMQTSYKDHVGRKSVKITYFCRYCNLSKVFYNRCNMLCHIRSHAFKTATINITDLTIEPLPLKFYNMNILLTSKSPQRQEQIIPNTNCPECKKSLDVTTTGSIQKAIAKHYMELIKIRTCPVCMIALPSICAFKAHLRFHLKRPPFICPECGINIGPKTPIYPYNHSCEGFRMMRSTARIKCQVPTCYLVHPSEYKAHIELNHLKKVFKCPFCYVACFSSTIMERHLNNHDLVGEAITFYQCEMCPGKLVLINQIENHMKTHIDNNNSTYYPCWACGTIFKQVLPLIEHYVVVHDRASKEVIKNSVRSILNSEKTKKIYRVVKRCEQCKRSFTYKCNFDRIKTLPNECPYKCTLGSGKDNRSLLAHEQTLTCHMCQDKISQDWEEIKKHFSEHHKAYRCLDLKIELPKIDIEKYLNKKQSNSKGGVAKKKVTRRRRRNRRNENNEGVMENIINQDSTVSDSTAANQFICKKCGYQFQKRELWESHIITHRDPCMAYQCMECGQCFVVKPSFSKHLLIEHGIQDVENYITEKCCFNENALTKYQDNSTSSEPLRENQCKICREQFDDTSDLEKHFRVHGMAFLMKNNSSKNISP